MPVTDKPKHTLSLSALSLSLSFCFYLVEINDWLLAYELILDLLIVVSLIATIGLFSISIIKVIETKKFPSFISVILFTIILSTYVFTYGNRNGLFWGKQILNANFIDDRSGMQLELYENGKYFIYYNWLFAEKRFEGTYYMERDTINFHNSPVIDNGFVSKKIIIDHGNKRIYFKKNTDESYDKSFYYFQIMED